ncbi:MAG: PAS domain S-box protein [Bacteroidetes bacterium]|nr:PAS domain S-box protein [Bacteroidota bacterium]
MEQVLKNGNWTAEVKHFKKDGTPIYIENSVTVFNKVNEDNFLLVTINQDITERKIVQKKLKILNSDLINQVEQKTNEITDIFSRISDCFVSLDKEGHIIYINQAAEEFIGLPKPQLLGAKLMDLFGTGIETPLSSRLRYAIENESYSEFEEQAFKSKRWVSLKVYPSPNSTSIFFLDISERKKNEFALQENEKKYRLLFENNPIPMWVLDINTRLIIDVNEAAIQNYGYTREEFIGKSAFELRDENERHRFNKIMKPGDSENSSTGHWLHKRKDGSTIVVEIMAYTLFYDNRPCRLILANDVTEKIKAQHEIESSRDQLRQLSGYLEKVREEERTTIAREIHDELGQQLTGLKIDLSWFAKRIDQTDRQKTQKVAEMMSLIDETVKTVRKIASELRPGILDDLGLIAALDWQSKEFEKRTGVICRFNHDFSDKSFDKNTATGIFRIYQEALTNVARHAGATEVESFLTLIDQDCIEFTIIDNGKGMGNDLSPKKTLGLIGMKERALMMRGSLHIDSHEGKGTKINLKVPIEN